MTIPVKKLGEISLAIFESIFASKICNFQDTKAIISYFNEFDESILSLIHEKINDEYELEKVDDYLLTKINLSFLWIKTAVHRGTYLFPAMESCTQRSVDNSLKN